LAIGACEKEAFMNKIDKQEKWDEAEYRRAFEAVRRVLTKHNGCLALAQSVSLLTQPYWPSGPVTNDAAESRRIRPRI